MEWFGFCEILRALTLWSKSAGRFSDASSWTEPTSST